MKGFTAPSSEEGLRNTPTAHTGSQHKVLMAAVSTEVITGCLPGRHSRAEGGEGMNGNGTPSNSAALCLHPNELDRRRIERALQHRKRYRYVTPNVCPSADGYVIQSPCCSRNIDCDGGVIDIAKLEFHADRRCWRLYHKDHEIGHWIMHGEYQSWSQILDLLNQDPDRRFWQ
jgi:hypothetical protein